MKRGIATSGLALLGTGVVIWGFAAILNHTVFFYTANGYMSPKTAVHAGLLKDEEAQSSGALDFRKTSPGGYDYREEMARGFIGLTGHTDIDLVAECERLGGCVWRKREDGPYEPTKGTIIQRD